jgi:hypothetical protein
MCKGIRELVLPDSVTEISSYAFRDCIGLRKIVLPKGLKTLRHEVFAFTYLPAKLHKPVFADVPAISVYSCDRNRFKNRSASFQFPQQPISAMCPPI